MEQISYIEQDPGSEIISIFAESGNRFHINQSELEKFIEVNGMNYTTEVVGNNSPSGDDDPSYDIEEEIPSDPSDYLDNHLYQVCELYINSPKASNLLKHVA